MIRASLVCLAALTAACDPSEKCEEPGAICTYMGNGTAGLGPDGTDRLEAMLYLPQDLTFGPDDKPYLLDWNNHRILTVDSDDTIDVVAGTGLLGDGPEGPALAAAFNHPTNIAFDPTGGLVISAWHNSRIERVDLETGNLEFLAGTGGRGYNGDEIAAETAILDLPSAVGFDSTGRMFLSDQANQQIRMVDQGIIYDVAGTQRVTGYTGDGGPATSATFLGTVGQAADPANRLFIHDDVIYVADTGNHVIRSIDIATWTIDTFAGTKACDGGGVCTGTEGDDDGPKLEATFSSPRDLHVTDDGTIYVADTGNSCVRRISPDGDVDTVAGVCGSEGYEGDYGPASEALLFRPYGVTVDHHGDLYIADTYNQTVRVVKAP